jgi:hypothetical protein
MLHQDANREMFPLRISSKTHPEFPYMSRLLRLHYIATGVEAYYFKIRTDDLDERYDDLYGEPISTEFQHTHGEAYYNPICIPVRPTNFIFEGILNLFGYEETDEWDIYLCREIMEEHDIIPIVGDDVVVYGIRYKITEVKPENYFRTYKDKHLEWRCIVKQKRDEEMYLVSTHGASVSLG